MNLAMFVTRKEQFSSTQFISCLSHDGNCICFVDRIYVDASIDDVSLTVSSCRSNVTRGATSSSLISPHCLTDVSIVEDSPPVDFVSVAGSRSMGPVEFHEVKTTNVTAGLGTGGFFYVGVSSDRTARFKLRLDAAGVCTVSGNGGESKPSFVSHGLSEHGCPLWKELVRVSRPRDFETDFMVEVGFLVSTFCLLP